MISSCLNDSHHTHTQAYTLFTQAAPCTLPLHIDKIFFNKWYFFAIITSFISAAHSARPTANKKFAPLFSSFSSRSCVFHLCMLHISLQLQLACTFFASVLMFELCLFFLFSSHLIWLTVFIYLFFLLCAKVLSLICILPLCVQLEYTYIHPHWIVSAFDNYNDNNEGSWWHCVKGVGGYKVSEEDKPSHFKWSRTI